MPTDRFDDLLSETKLIAILRGISGADLTAMLQALYEGGIRLAEVTLNTPGALSAISAIRKHWQHRMMIGAGTVTCLSEAEDALAAGAEFIVTPNVDADVIRLCVRRGVPITPGALTPTEIITACRCGSKYVKLFPAGALGPAYVKQLLGPLNGTKLLVVGGIHEGNLREFLQSGAYGAGIGGGLGHVPENRDFSLVTDQARRLLQAAL